MVRILGGCWHFGRRSIQFRPIVVMICLLGYRLVEIDPDCNHEGVVGLDEGCPVGSFYVVGGCHCSFDDSKGDLDVVEALL